MGTRALFTFVYNGEELVHFWNQFDGSFDGESDGGKGMKVYKYLKLVGEHGIDILLKQLKNAIKIDSSKYKELYGKYAEQHYQLDEEWKKIRKEYGVLNTNIQLHFNPLYPTLGNDILLFVKELINPTLMFSSPILISWTYNELEKLKSNAQYKYMIDLSKRTFCIVNYEGIPKTLDILTDNI